MHKAVRWHDFSKMACNSKEFSRINSLMSLPKENLSIFVLGSSAPHKKSKSSELDVSAMSISQNPLIVKVGMTKFVQHGRNMKKRQTSCIQNLVAS